MITAIILGFLKDNFHWVIIAGLTIALILSVKSCTDQKETILRNESAFNKTLRHELDKAQEREVIARTVYAKKLALSDSILAASIDSLGVKMKQLNNVKVIELEKTVHDTVQKYDTIYKMLTPDLRTFTKEFDDCLTVKGEFRPDGLYMEADRSLKLYDINYTKRRKLFGWRIAPNWGRKEFYQTLVTNCNDTITENKKITFDGKP